MILNLTNLELDFLHLLRNLSNKALDSIFEIITFFGEQYAIIIILVILYYAVSKKIGQRILYSIVTSINFNNFLKLIIKRPRPFSDVHQNPVVPARLETASGYSFPSGHTQNASVTYSSLSINFKKKYVIIPSIILIVLIGFSRLWLGCHYPSDVICGLIFGVSAAFLLNYIHSKLEDSKKKKYYLYIITSLIFLPFIVISFINFYSGKAEYFLTKDAFVSYGLMVGAFCGIFLEEKVLDFKDTTNKKLKLLRTIFGFVFVILVYLILSFIFKKINPECPILDIIRYFMISFTALGIYPIVTKKWLF